MLLFTFIIQYEIDAASVDWSSKDEDGITHDNESNHEKFDFNPTHKGFLLVVQEFKWRGPSIEIADNCEIKDLQEDANDLHDESVGVYFTREVRERYEMEGPEDQVECRPSVDPERSTCSLPFQLFVE